jgi:hypothetical protein
VTGPADLLVLLGVGTLAGIVSTVASLASIVSYPALLALGLPPVTANVTNTVALMFTGLGAAAGSRPELAGQGRRVLRFGLVTAVGGGLGAALLLLTPSLAFEYVAPVLIAAGSLAVLRRPAARAPEATGPAEVPSAASDAAVAPAEPVSPVPPASAVVAAGGVVGPGEAGVGGASTASAAHNSPSDSVTAPDRPVARAPGDDASRERGWRPRAAVFAVAVYVGYFGAAGGILMLALLIRILPQSLARTNAVKNVISGLANAVAGIGFAIFGPVRWSAALPLAAGFLIGGAIGPSLVRRLPARALRVFVGVSGLLLALRLGLSAYL